MPLAAPVTTDEARTVLAENDGLLDGLASDDQLLLALRDLIREAQARIEE